MLRTFNNYDSVQEYNYFELGQSFPHKNKHNFLGASVPHYPSMVISNNTSMFHKVFQASGFRSDYPLLW